MNIIASLQLIKIGGNGIKMADSGRKKQRIVEIIRVCESEASETVSLSQAFVIYCSRL